MKIVALIPARAGSKRVPGKNTRLLGGKPLIQWSVDAALDSGVFDSIWVCSDDLAAWTTITRRLSVNFYEREDSADDEPDIAWMRLVIPMTDADAFAILRPTSPFRTADTIRRAYAYFRECGYAADSLRAVQPVREHPYKCWTCEGPGHPIKPLFPGTHPDGTPFHSSPTQTLPQVYVQNSSLEMSWTSNLTVHGTISGRKVAPFFTDGREGFAIDYPEDWDRAERYVAHLQTAAAAE
jgi:CMP-N,N'-diacetyllegionaminic acid synthase